MIVKMNKVYIVSRAGDREKLLATLGELGVVHLKPVDPGQAVPEEKTTTAIERLERAIQILSAVGAEGQQAEVSAAEAAEEALDIQRKSAEYTSRLATLHRQIEQLALWGDVKVEQFEQLRQAGIEVKFYSVPADEVNQVQAELVQELTALAGKRKMVAVIDRAGNVSLPEQAVPIELPQRDRPAIRAEAAQIDQKLKQSNQRLHQLAHLIPALHNELRQRRQEAAFTVAHRGGLAADDLFAVQGWVPVPVGDHLAGRLEQARLDAAVQISAPAADDQPPTLIQSPKWARPIEGLFNLLGTVAGYREFDVSVPFMIALPIFAAMLIGDAGYGAILFLGPLLLYKKAARALGAQFTRLIMVIGAVAFIWGLLCGSFFGVVPYTPLIPVNMSDESRTLVMRISFIMGAIHLSGAQLWQAVSLFPNLRFLNRVGWAVFVWGMLGVVQMFVFGAVMDAGTPWPYLLLAGAVLAIVFAHPSRNPAKMLALGLASFPLSMLSAFSDVISYVRLMAVGLASGVLAGSFNELAISSGHWAIAVPILLFGHSLNIGLALIALFAHGVRLNMLEFCNNLGMEWTGYSYKPFAVQTIQEK